MLQKYVDRRDGGYIWREVGGEIIILTRDGEWIHTLNEVGSEIWKLADGKMTVNELISKICEEFEINRETAEQDTIKFIQKLLKKDLITLHEKLTET
jgi:hypothetical protein